MKKKSTDQKNFRNQKQIKNQKNMGWNEKHDQFQLNDKLKQTKTFIKKSGKEKGNKR